MTEARRLLRELADEMALWRANKPAAYVDKYERARAYLAMTTCEGLTAEEQKWADATMDNTKAWLVPSLRAAAGRVAESRAREGELVAALEDARMLCKNDHAYDNKNSQVFEAVQVMNRALQGGARDG